MWCYPQQRQKGKNLSGLKPNHLNLRLKIGLTHIKNQNKTCMKMYLLLCSIFSLLCIWIEVRTSVKYWVTIWPVILIFWSYWNKLKYIDLKNFVQQEKNQTTLDTSELVFCLFSCCGILRQKRHLKYVNAWEIIWHSANKTMSMDMLNYIK